MKLLKDWTLGEIQDYCDNHHCSECDFYEYCDDNSPDNWNLNRPMGPDRDPKDFILKD